MVPYLLRVGEGQSQEVRKLPIVLAFFPTWVGGVATFPGILLVCDNCL